MARPFFECHFLGQPHASHKLSSKSYSKTPHLQKKEQDKIHIIQISKPLFVLVYKRELEKKAKRFRKQFSPQVKHVKNVYIFRQTFRILVHIVAKNMSSNTLFVCDDLSFSVHQNVERNLVNKTDKPRQFSLCRILFQN